MADEQNAPQLPVATIGEAVTGAVMLLSTLPHQEWGLGFFYALVAGGIWATRRSNTVREIVEAKVEEMEINSSPRLLTWAVSRTVVPPAGNTFPLLGTAKRQKKKEPLEAVRVASAGSSTLHQGLLDLFGNDNPLNAKTRRPKAHSRIDTRRSNGRRRSHADSTTKAVQWVTDTLEADTPSCIALSLQDAVEALNLEVDDSPHIFIVGNSGTGKTALAQLIVGTRPGKVVILDPKRPKGYEGPKWGGLPYVSRDTDGGYTSMLVALSEVVREMDDRYKRQETATEPFQQLTVVIDEAKNTLEEAPDLAVFYRKIVSIGREVGVRLILISTTDRARKLGFDGEADSMDSFTWVRLGEFAVRVLPDVTGRGVDRFYHAVVRRFGAWAAFENELAYGLVKDHLKLRPTKAWEAVTYNCQLLRPVERVQEREDSTSGSSNRPTRVSFPMKVTAAARETAVAIAQPAVSAPEPDFDLLTSLLTSGSVKTSERELSLEEKAKVYLAAAEAAKYQIGTPGGTSPPTTAAEVTSAVDVSRLTSTLLVAKNRLRELSCELGKIPEQDRKRALNVLHSIQSGAALSKAIQAEYGATGGRVFTRVAAWVKLMQEVTELVAKIRKEQDKRDDEN